MSNNGALVGKLRGIVNFETFDTGFGIINEYYQKIIKNTAKRFNIFFFFFSHKRSDREREPRSLVNIYGTHILP
jgi:hypothetical protein